MPAFFFFFNDTATTEIYTLSLHDALPIYPQLLAQRALLRSTDEQVPQALSNWRPTEQRSEEHTSELQSPCNLVCRLLLEKKKDERNTDVRIALEQCGADHVCEHVYKVHLE